MVEDYFFLEFLLWSCEKVQWDFELVEGRELWGRGWGSKVEMMMVELFEGNTKSEKV